MKKLLDIANRYIKTSDWKTITVLKFCLLALGILFGLSVGEKRKKPVRIAACAVFLATYIPLMVKLFSIVEERCCEAEDSEEPEYTVPEDPEPEYGDEPEEEDETESENESEEEEEI
jgi:hypothetical protein